jgi:hypothetical protein
LKRKYTIENNNDNDDGFGDSRGLHASKRKWSNFDEISEHSVFYYKNDVKTVNRKMIYFIGNTTDDGFRIYSAEELNINRGGGTVIFFNL